MEVSSSTYQPVNKYEEDSDLSPAEAFDVILNDVKSAGRWQIYLFLMTSFCGYFISMQNMASAVISASPEFWCNVTGIDELDVSLPEVRTQLQNLFPKCEYYASIDGEVVLSIDNEIFKNTSDLTVTECDSWIYDTSIYSSTTVSEWDLVCDRKWLNSASQSIYMGGVLIGGLFLSELSDAYGRRTICLFSTVFYIICSVLTSFSINYSSFVILRFATAFFAFGIFIPNFVLLMEMLGPKGRASMGILYHGLFGVGICALSGIGYAIRDWRIVQLVISAPSAVLIFYFRYLPESPRWLLSKGKKKEAIAILKKVAKTNGGRLPEEKDLDFLISRISGSKPERYNIFQMIFRFFKNQVRLVRTKVIRRRSLIMFFDWFVVSMVYYGLAFSASNINTSVYLLVFLSGLSEAIAILAASWTISRFGRRLNLAISFLIAGVCCLLMIAVPKRLVWINVTLASLGKFFTSAAFAVNYIFSAELVPTEMRNISVGTCSMYARFGSMIAPFIVDLLGEVHYVIPSTIFGILSIMAALLTLLLPETDHQKLPETIDEIEKLDR